MDAIQLLKKDHRDIEQLFRAFERAEREGDVGRQRVIVRALVRELSVHASLEEQLVYPAVRRAGKVDGALEALEEHHAAKMTLRELDAMPVTAERFAAKVHVLAEAVRRHVDEEERSLLPALDRALDAGELRALGDTLERARGVAPTRPHPLAPDEPPGVYLAGALAAVYDRARDAMRGALDLLVGIAARTADGIVHSVRRFGERVETEGRAYAREMRAQADEMATRGRDVIEIAERRGRETVRRAQETARQSARTARRGARATARAARGEEGTVH